MSGRDGSFTKGPLSARLPGGLPQGLAGKLAEERAALRRFMTIPLDCAWCYCATKVDGRWLPIPRAIALARKYSASHGICTICQAATADNWR